MSIHHHLTSLSLSPTLYLPLKYLFVSQNIHRVLLSHQDEGEANSSTFS